MQFRIGRRDPATGLYYVIHPDGSELLNGIKIFNATYTVGDSVLATQRSDGMMILDGINAVEGVPSPSPFNDEEEELPPTITVKLAPDSPTAANPGDNFQPFYRNGYQGLFIDTFTSVQFLPTVDLIVRFSIVRPIRRKLKIDVKIIDANLKLDDFLIISGEVVIRPTVSGDDVFTTIELPAGKTFVDIIFAPGKVSYEKNAYSPVLNAVKSTPRARQIKSGITLPFKNDQSIIIKLIQSIAYRGSSDLMRPYVYMSNVDYAEMPSFQAGYAAYLPDPRPVSPDPYSSLRTGFADNYPDVIFPPEFEYPSGKAPIQLPLQDLYGSINPDTSINRYLNNRFYHIPIRWMTERAQSLNQRYIYIIGAAIHGYFDITNRSQEGLEGLNFFNDSIASFTHRFNVSAEIGGTIGLFPNQVVPTTLSSINPYFRPESNHRGYMQNVGGLFRIVGTRAPYYFSNIFTQYCFKVDTLNPQESIFIPSFVPPFVLAGPGAVVNPNTQIIRI